MNAQALQQFIPARHEPRTSAADIGRAAILALHDELSLAPKPGLVSFVDSGSHVDMDARTFMRSIFALRNVFPRFAALGARMETFAALEQEGITAETALQLEAALGVEAEFWIRAQFVWDCYRLREVERRTVAFEHEGKAKRSKSDKGA